ncbi:hypothetical protein M1373_00390 [Candidatus Marsarchaeota archaeon]|nr:hypothetical protein [Candidatus Marsarchaeota archaeon]MCL5404476.1 hypothetical protein [Candidatus Marsarchaeota archaeon]
MNYACIFAAMLIAAMIIAGNASAAVVPTANESGAFFNGSEAVYVYSGNYSCYPPLSALPNSQSNASSVTQCYAGISAPKTDALPDWILVPAYAGMSIFGYSAYNSIDGFASFNNSLVYTDCGAGGTQSECPIDPKLVYSPLFSAIEAEDTNFSSSLPAGVLPMPAHTHFVNTTFSEDLIPWYLVVVYVFDPNIMPNATTGKCVQSVASNLSNPTGNCLTSLAALERAASTYSNATVNANSGNPIWIAMGRPEAQVYVPGYANGSSIGNPNTNIVVPFAVKPGNFYSAAVNTTTVPQAKVQRHGNYDIYAAIAIAAVVLVAAAIALALRKMKA